VTNIAVTASFILKVSVAMRDTKGSGFVCALRIVDFYLTLITDY